jgi:long-chain acyl-CoA synthetase
MTAHASLQVPDLERQDTMPKLLRHNAERFPRETAMREKDFGIWREYTWADCATEVRRMALGLKAMGVGKGDVVGLIGQNRPAWVFGQIATHALGAMSLGIYKDSLNEEVGYLMNYAGIKVVIAEDEEQADKFVHLGTETPSVAQIVYCNTRGMRKYEDARLISVAQVLAEADKLHDKEPALYGHLVDETRGEDVAILCTTSGTTAHPKVAMLQAGPFLRHCAKALANDPRQPGDDYVSVLPLPWIGEQFFAVGEFLVTRQIVNFVEDEETTMRDMREIGPTSILYPPRVWEAIAADVKARIMDSSKWKRALYAWGVRSGLKAVDRGRRPWFADFLVGRALRDRVGFSKVKSAMTGGAPLGPDTFRFFRAIGVPLRQVYGQTELAGLYCAHPLDDVDYDTVGVPYDGVEVRIDNADRNGLGEVVARHPAMFTGYYKNAQATAADVRDGWMHTGDAGYFNERGHLVVVDRVRDLAELESGERFSPQYVELKLKFSPYIGECVALGHGRSFVSAIICIRHSIVSKWAEKRHIPFTTYSDLAARPEIRDLIRAEVEKVNAGLPPSQRICRALLLYKELDPDDGELTRTRKVRRGTVNERYGFLIDALYQGVPSVAVDTTITLQDGRAQRIRANVEIVELLPPPKKTAEAMREKVAV